MKTLEPNSVMLDLETLGTDPGSIILSIGATFFHPTMGLEASFYQVISVQSCADAGLLTSPGTLAWWKNQSLEARKVLITAESPEARPLKEALADFNAFLSLGGEEVRVWGNGSDFDNVLLKTAYDRVGVKPAWKFYNNRCYRTLKNLAPHIEMDRKGTHHNALDDARSQALHAIRIASQLRFSVPVALL